MLAYTYQIILIIRCYAGVGLLFRTCYITFIPLQTAKMLYNFFTEKMSSNGSFFFIKKKIKKLLERFEDIAQNDNQNLKK